MGNVYKYHRRSLRLKHYDYSRAGYYFVTICAQGREHLFGEIVEGKMVLNVAGEMIESSWHHIMDDFPNVYLHEFVIMPNHIHGIIEIVDNVGADSISALPTSDSISAHERMNEIERINNHECVIEHASQRVVINSNKRADMESAPTLSKIIQSFKRHTTIQYIKMVKNGTCPPFNKRIWQRNYHEHIIRNDADYERVATYTINNPLTWENDMFGKP